MAYSNHYSIDGFSNSMFILPALYLYQQNADGETLNEQEYQSKKEEKRLLIC